MNSGDDGYRGAGRADGDGGVSGGGGGGVIGGAGVVTIRVDWGDGGEREASDGGAGGGGKWWRWGVVKKQIEVRVHCDASSIRFHT